MVCFDCLPLAAIVNDKFMALHGGLSPDLNELQDVEVINRFHDPPQIGIICDILWADPIDSEDGKIYDGFKVNETRGCSYYYGYEACQNFLTRNNLLTIIRAHESQIEGYKVHNWNNEGYPQVITIFSAPNYCDVYNNKAAYIHLIENDIEIK
jgi:serine/threonine-protein phosphatase 2B catalytic subunit